MSCHYARPSFLSMVVTSICNKKYGFVFLTLSWAAWRRCLAVTHAKIRCQRKTLHICRVYPSSLHMKRYSTKGSGRLQYFTHQRSRNSIPWLHPRLQKHRPVTYGVVFFISYDSEWRNVFISLRSPALIHSCVDDGYVHGRRVCSFFSLTYFNCNRGVAQRQM